MATGECSAYSSLQADSKVKFAAWLTSWRPPGADRLSPRGPCLLTCPQRGFDHGTSREVAPQASVLPREHCNLSHNN